MADESKVMKRLTDYMKTRDDTLMLRITNITGCSDHIACMDGAFWALEEKDDNNGAYGLRKDQEVFLRKVKAAGGETALIDKHMVEDFAMLDDYFQNPNEYKYDYMEERTNVYALRETMKRLSDELQDANDRILDLEADLAEYRRNEIAASCDCWA